MRERNSELIGSNGDRELWQSEVETPDKEWEVMFRGKVFMQVRDMLMETPEKPVFFDEAKARAWLETGTDEGGN